MTFWKNKNNNNKKGTGQSLDSLTLAFRNPKQLNLDLFPKKDAINPWASYPATWNSRLHIGETHMLEVSYFHDISLTSKNSSFFIVYKIDGYLSML